MYHKSEQEIMRKWRNTSDTPKVSICSISYNQQNFIEEALDSFLMQRTDFPFEILIDDDCSTDKTGEIIGRYMREYPNIINARIRTENIGSMSNFIENIERAKGRYIAMCEGDDFWTSPLKLQKQVDFLENNDSFSGCFHDCKRIYENMERKENLRVGKRKIEHEPDLISVINENNIATASIVFKNLEGIMPPYWKKTTKGDYALMLTIAEKGKLKYLPEVMSVYRVHDKGIWSSCGEIYKEKENIKFYSLLRKHFSGRTEVLSEIEKKIKYSYFIMARKLTYEKKRVLSIYYMFLSFSFFNKKHKGIDYTRYIKELLKSTWRMR